METILGLHQAWLFVCCELCIAMGTNSGFKYVSTKMSPSYSIKMKAKDASAQNVLFVTKGSSQRNADGHSSPLWKELLSPNSETF